MENQKMMSKWEKWGVGTAIAAGLEIIISFLIGFPHAPDGMVFVDFSIIFLLPVFFAWSIFTMMLIVSENKPFLPSKENWRKQVRDGVITLLAVGLFMLIAHFI